MLCGSAIMSTTFGEINTIVALAVNKLSTKQLEHNQRKFNNIIIMEESNRDQRFKIYTYRIYLMDLL